MPREERSSFSISFSFFSFLAIAILILPAHSALAQQAGKPASPEPGSGDIARGRYLVQDVAMCGQCHTPRDSNGSLEKSRELQGAPVTWVPAASDPQWPLRAPRIGGNPPASDEDMVKLLTTGIWTDGKRLRFPMMPFRMSESDARAVVAYLRSLPPQQ